MTESLRCADASWRTPPPVRRQAPCGAAARAAPGGAPGGDGLSDGPAEGALHGVTPRLLIIRLPGWERMSDTGRPAGGHDHHVTRSHWRPGHLLARGPHHSRGSRHAARLPHHAARGPRMRPPAFERNFVHFPVLLNCPLDVTFDGDSSYHRWSRPSRPSLPAGTLWLPASRDAFSTASDQDGRRPRPDISHSRKARPSGFRTPAILDHQRRPTQPAA